MSSLNWDAFERLPGAADANFELLCRALIRRTYARYGDFNALANQPGVEFHLKLNTACSLGQAGDWFGWQCRWYGLAGGVLIGAARRKKIEEAIVTANKHIPSLTHWVLWTRRPLAADDQRWFTGLIAPFKLVQWTASEVEEHLTGEAEVFRATYFGDLVLTPEGLTNLHAQAVAPVRRRWLPEVHLPLQAEKTIRRVLGDKKVWQSLGESLGQLTADVDVAEVDIGKMAAPLADHGTKTSVFARSTIARIERIISLLKKGDIDALSHMLAAGPIRPEADVAALPHRLRAARHAAVLTITNLLAAVSHANNLQGLLATSLNSRLMAVTAEAGCGKTELAAQLSVQSAERPAGILLHGRDLRTGDSLDNLASRVIINGVPVPSMQALVAAVDSAGQRSGHRLPIIIDGLNEAEDPRDWKPGLASLLETLQQFQYVVVVCTLRPAFKEEALPDTIHPLHIAGFEQDIVEAVRQYFTYYRINAMDADLPWDLLNHPLTLRIFCEVCNHERQQEVGVEAMPSSLTNLFERYLEQTADRIAELAPRKNRYYKADIRRALVILGTALWEKKARQLALNELRRLLSDETRPWDESLVRAMEQDGVILRDPRDLQTNDQQVSVAYDRLAGHIIASALLEQHSKDSLHRFLREPETTAGLRETGQGNHPLGDDILIGLVGLTPKRLYGEQVWRLVDLPLRSVALRWTARLDGASLDAATVEELAKQVTGTYEEKNSLFKRLSETRGVLAHPLNTEFLDRVLRPMTVANRDTTWTEWTRRNEEWLLNDLEALEQVWREKPQHSLPDMLRARWIMWLLTSTVRTLRDQATRSLYWFGRLDADGLFRLALESFEINDLYVTERTMAAAYGVVMAHQLPDPKFIESLRSFMVGLQSRLLIPNATHPTNHWLIRLYVQGIWDLARTYHPASVPDGIPLEREHLPFAKGLEFEPVSAKDERASEVNQTLQMDFTNYTLGRLIVDRHNYDMTHPSHQAAVDQVRGTIWALGWRTVHFASIDKEIADTRRYQRRQRSKVERYGKKYGWIGFYLHAGCIADAGQPFKDSRLSDLGIDPSFPEPLLPKSIAMPRWADTDPADDMNWLRSASINLPNEFLYLTELDGTPGPWVAVYAWLNDENDDLGREVFGSLAAVLVSVDDENRLVTELMTPEARVAHNQPDFPSDHYTFAGEIPWSNWICNDEGIYKTSIAMKSGSDIDIEILGHTFAWESYHSELNQAGEIVFPSLSFSTKFDLRSLPQSFDQVEPDGKIATKSFLAPSEFKGWLLYIRADLLKRYAGSRRVVWWGEGRRRLTRPASELREELTEVYEKGEDLWFIVKKGNDLFPFN